MTDKHKSNKEWNTRKLNSNSFYYYTHYFYYSRNIPNHLPLPFASAFLFTYNQFNMFLSNVSAEDLYKE